jgi:hypothetical protein
MFTAGVEVQGRPHVLGLGLHLGALKAKWGNVAASSTYDMYALQCSSDAASVCYNTRRAVHAPAPRSVALTGHTFVSVLAVMHTGCVP